MRRNRCKKKKNTCLMQWRKRSKNQRKNHNRMKTHPKQWTCKRIWLELKMKMSVCTENNLMTSKKTNSHREISWTKTKRSLNMMKSNWKMTTFKMTISNISER